MEYWSSGVMEYCRIGVMEKWSDGAMEYRSNARNTGENLAAQFLAFFPITPTLQYSSTPIFQHSNLPTLHYSSWVLYVDL
jgi:hypothetical protein